MQLDYEYLSRIRRAVSLYTNRKTSNILDGDFHSIHRGRSMEFDDLKTYTFGDPSKVGPVSEKLYNYLRGIQDGLIEDPHGWCYFL